MHDRKRERTLAKKLVTARNDAGLTQKDVENSGIISQTNLSKSENAERTMSFLELENLANLYKKPLEFFKTNKDE